MTEFYIINNNEKIIINRFSSLEDLNSEIENYSLKDSNIPKEFIKNNQIIDDFFDFIIFTERIDYVFEKNTLFEMYEYCKQNLKSLIINNNEIFVKGLYKSIKDFVVQELIEDLEFKEAYNEASYLIEYIDYNKIFKERYSHYTPIKTKDWIVIVNPSL